MRTIAVMGKICKEICVEADAFEAFSGRFLVEGDVVNSDLKEVIRNY